MNELLSSIKSNGFCRVENAFSNSEVKDINESIDRYIESSHDGIVHEENSSIVRAIHGPHLFNNFFMDISKKKLFVDFAQKYLNDLIYIHQYKINMKRAIDGESWPWHQDYIFWKESDHIQSSNLLNVAVALDDISMLNGPLCVIPGSHKLGNLSKYDGGNRAGWSQDVSSDLTYKIDKKTLVPLIEERGHEFLTCRAGDAIFFDPQIAHASSNNISPVDRRLLIITYNAVSNAPVKKSDRPAFLSATDFTPIC